MKKTFILSPCILLAVLVSGCTQQPIGGVPDAWEGYLDPEGCNSSCMAMGYDVGHCMHPEEICEDDVESGNCLPGACEKDGDCRCYCKNETLPEDQCCTRQNTNFSMCLPEAMEIAENSACVENGTLTENHFCNEYTGTWWIDLDIEKDGCSPACVVDVETGQAEINWRCTGLLLPE